MKPLLLFCATLPALCQPAFTVASMKQTEFLADKRPVVIVNPGRLTLTGLTLQSLIARAYSVKEYQVRGPEWIAAERYTIAATMPDGTPEPMVWQMLQTLLAERLELKLRRAPEEMPVYAMVAGRNGPKLKPAAGGALAVTLRGGAFRAKNATMQNVISLLGSLLDRPVVDQTGLGGTYDFELFFSPDTNLGPAMKKLSEEMRMTNAEAHGPSIFTAVQEQLGLKLEPRRAPVEVLSVQSVLKVPTEN